MPRISHCRRRPVRARLLWIAAVLLAAARPAGAAEVDFRRDIEPILIENCYECHGPKTRKGDLRLTNRDDAFSPGQLGTPVIEPGRSDLSPLIDLIRSADATERMPKERSPLSAAQIELIRRWIDEGATWPDGGPTPHWAYAPPRRPSLPQVSDQSWPRNPVDAFVLARLEREGLSPSPPADPATLLRRVHLDLIGIPPTVDEVRAFVADPSPRAYEETVDRLLASPRFGEHWAREWLDAARYADSNGYKSDSLRTVWPYRDWVIRAINDDMPYDRFTVQQLAGDLGPSPTPDQILATGFLRNSPLSLEAGVDFEEARIEQVRDRLNTIATTWLGTTIECAQCHDHKYDPISIEEYYRLFAYLNSSPLEVVQAGAFNQLGGPTLAVEPAPEVQRRRDQLEAQLQAARQEFDATIPPPHAVRQWIERMAEVYQASAGWQRAHVERFSTSSGEPYRILPDGSVLLVGQGPYEATYTVEISTDLPTVTGIRLELLADPSLPEGGPGRGAGIEQPFVLSEMRVFDVGALRYLGTDSPSANSDTTATPVRAAIDGEQASGWAPHEMARGDHWAVFPLSTDATAAPAGGRLRLTIELDQKAGLGRTIGRLAFRVTDLSGEFLRLPSETQTRLTAGAVSAREDQRLFHLARRHLGDSSLQPNIDRIAAKLSPLRKPTSLVMAELETPRTTHVFLRGNHLQPGATVQPGVPAVLNSLPAGALPNRLGLARWIVDPANPLTARVTVNRWWYQIFGRGLVETLEDFGTRGARPTHPELLDWLAVELVEKGWSRKQILRLLVTSSTYRQRSGLHSKQALEKDPEVQLLWRMPRLRLPAETIRDQALAVSGLLVERIGGPPIYPPQPDGLWRQSGSVNPPYAVDQGDDRFRRGLYVVWRRVSPPPTMALLDAPDRSTCTVRRRSTNTPLQALALMNDAGYAEMAVALAARILEQAPGKTDDDRIRYAIRLVLTREPRDGEVPALQRHLTRVRHDVAADTGFVERVASSLPRAPSTPIPPAEVAAWYQIAIVLLNLDETVTRS